MGSRPCEKRFTAQQQLALYGRVTFVERKHWACGDVALCIGDHVEVWKDTESFVRFWCSMSERRFAAYCAGVFADKQRVHYAELEPATMGIYGTLRMRAFM